MKLSFFKESLAGLAVDEAAERDTTWIDCSGTGVIRTVMLGQAKLSNDSSCVSGMFKLCLKYSTIKSEMSLVPCDMWGSYDGV